MDQSKSHIFSASQSPLQKLLSLAFSIFFFLSSRSNVMSSKSRIFDFLRLLRAMASLILSLAYRVGYLTLIRRRQEEVERDRKAFVGGGERRGLPTHLEWGSTLYINKYFYVSNKLYYNINKYNQQEQKIE